MPLLNVVPFEYQEIKDYIVQKFKDKGYSADYEGSNASFLADLLSFTASHLNTNTAFNTGEMLLTTATRTESVLNLARQQGYEAQGIVSYQYSITLRMKPDTTLSSNDTTLRIYELPRYSSFTSGTKSYYYMGDTVTYQRSNNDINNLDMGYITITLKEGTLYRYINYPSSLTTTIPTTTANDGTTNTQSYIDIPFTNVEDDGIEVFITYIDEFGVVQTDEEWFRTKQFLLDKDAILNKKFFRLDNISIKTPRVYFNIAGVGTVLRLNTLINTNVIVSSGSLGVATSTMNVSPELATSFSLYDGVDTARIQTLLVVGQDLEDKELIRENAPLFHNSANRAVTKYDYQSIVNRQNVTKYSQVWGGETEMIVRLGNVFISVVPNRIPNTFTNDSLLYNFSLVDSDNLVSLFLQPQEYRNNSFDGIFDILDEFSVMTIQKNAINPVYIDFNYNIRVVRYNRTVTKGSVHQSIFDVTNTYFMQTIEKSEAEYFHSNLIKRIDTIVSDSSGVVVDLTMNINIYPNNIEQSLSYNTQEKVFTCYLAVPYETYIDEGAVITSSLPNINTLNFLGTKNLVVDYTNLHLPMPSSAIDANPYFYYDIKVDGVICGKYIVMLGAVRFIRVDLFILVDGETHISSDYATTTLKTSDFSTKKQLNLDYYTDSMAFFKNSFPRLKTVSFVI